MYKKGRLVTLEDDDAQALIRAWRGALHNIVMARRVAHFPYIHDAFVSLQDAAVSFLMMVLSICLMMFL